MDVESLSKLEYKLFSKRQLISMMLVSNLLEVHKRKIIDKNQANKSVKPKKKEWATN